MGGTRRGHGYFKGAATKAMAGAAALLAGTALMGSAALAGGETPPPTAEEPTTTTLAPPTTVAAAQEPPTAAVPAGAPGVAAITDFSKAFSPASIPPGETSTLTFTIAVDENTTDLRFVDNLPANVTVAATPNASSNCAEPAGAVLTAAADSSTITFDGWDLAAADSPCEVVVDVTSSTPGEHPNETPELTAATPLETIPAGPDVILSVTPGFTKVFLPTSITVAGVSTLTYTIDNIGNPASATDLGFTDNLPTGLTVAATPNAATSCTGGTLTAAAASSTITYAGGTVPADSSCTVSVNVTASGAATYTSASEPLESSLGTGGTATATLTVTAVTATPVATPAASTPGAALAGTGGSTTTLLAAIGTFILAFGALLVYGSSQRRRPAQH